MGRNSPLARCAATREKRWAAMFRGAQGRRQGEAGHAQGLPRPGVRRPGSRRRSRQWRLRAPLGVRIPHAPCARRKGGFADAASHLAKPVDDRASRGTDPAKARRREPCIVFEGRHPRRGQRGRLVSRRSFADVECDCPRSREPGQDVVGMRLLPPAHGKRSPGKRPGRGAAGGVFPPPASRL